MAPGAKLMAVEVETEPSFVAGSTEMISSGYHYSASGRTYDVSPDGTRFLMIKESAGGDSAEFEIVLNWFEELKRRVPVDN